MSQERDYQMKIAVLGSGCAKCQKQYEHVQQAVTEAGVEVEVSKIEDIQEISQYNVLMTPALVVDGTVKSSGKVVKPEQIRKWIVESG